MFSTEDRNLLTGLFCVMAVAVVGALAITADRTDTAAPRRPQPVAANATLLDRACMIKVAATQPPAKALPGCVP